MEIKVKLALAHVADAGFFGFNEFFESIKTAIKLS